MTSRREASSPPHIPGFGPVRLLGMGGFADVFLYEQQMPRRSVAVKVLLAAHLDDEVRERFRTEADLMARLSHHPSIVTIHHADVAPDGRPFLVMEYCSRPGLGRRYRTERMAVSEVLRIGVRLASAVETAHRAGILHRDIKPANVLVTDFGWPALTDFGIAATTGLVSDGATGMSIPWSPPELLADNPTGDRRADVYSLAATIYSLLARRSPFEVPDGPNTAADLIARIERAPLSSTGRGDVPEALQAVLVRAMHRDPERRYPTALAFGRALQQIETEMMLPQTPFDLPDDTEASDGPGRPAAQDDDQATRVRPVRAIVPELTPASPVVTARGAQEDVARLDTRENPIVPAASRTAPVGSPDPGQDEAEPVAGQSTDGEAGALAAAQPSATTRGEQLSEDGIPASWHRPEPPEQAQRRPRALRVAALVGTAVVGAAAVTAAVLAFGPDRGPAPVESPPPATPTFEPVVAVPAPEDLTGVRTADGSVVFTWTNPDPREGDRYVWSEVRAGETTPVEPVDEPTVTFLPADPAGQTCIEVSVVRADRRASTTPAVGCVE